MRSAEPSRAGVAGSGLGGLGKTSAPRALWASAPCVWGGTGHLPRALPMSAAAQSSL